MVCRRNRLVWGCLAVLLVCGLTATPGAVSVAQTTFDVTGSWAFEVQIQAGAGTPAITFTQTGETLTGKYSSPMLGEAELKGTVKGSAIQFSFSVNVQGTVLDVTYTGTIESNDSMKGTVVLAGLGDGTFTGKRKK